MCPKNYQIWLRHFKDKSKNVHWPRFFGPCYTFITTNTVSQANFHSTKKNSLLSFSLVVGREFVKEFAVDFHEGLEYIVDERYDRLVPVFFWDPIQRRKHDRQDHCRVFFNQAHNVLVVPVVQCPLGHLQHHIEMLLIGRCHKTSCLTRPKI